MDDIILKSFGTIEGIQPTIMSKVFHLLPDELPSGKAGTYLEGSIRILP